MKKISIIFIFLLVISFAFGLFKNRTQAVDINLIASCSVQIGQACHDLFGAQAEACQASGSFVCNYSNQTLAFNCGMYRAGGAYCLPSTPPGTSCIVPMTEEELISTLGVSCTSGGGGGTGPGPGTGSLPGSTAEPNIQGISTEAQAKYFPNGFNPLSGRDQAVAAQLRVTESAKSTISKAYADFQNIVSGKRVGANSLGLLSKDAKPSTETTSPVVTGSVTMRYLKIDMVRAGWVAVRDVEFYDSTRSKISLSKASATASCTWCNYGATPPSVGPSSAIDGNVNTMWNAGETAPDVCNWLTGSGCPANTIRTGWISIDLGTTITVSRIRVSSTGNTNETSTLYTSSDGTNWTKLTQFAGTQSSPIKDYQWLEWPASSNITTPPPATGKTYAGPPSATLTVNGSSSTNLAPMGEGAIIEWNSANSDDASFSVSGFNPQCIPNGQPDPYLWKSFPYAGDNASGIHGLGNQYKGQYYFDDYLLGCESGRTITITYTAKQLYGGKTATASVTLKMGNKLAAMPKVRTRPNSTDQMWGYEINASYNEYHSTAGSNKVIVPQINVDNGTYLSNWNIPGSTDITAAYPWPTLSVESLTSGINASLGSPTILQTTTPGTLNARETVPLTISSASGTASGIYKIRIYGNKGQDDQGFYDIPVFVTGASDARSVTKSTQ